MVKHVFTHESSPASLIAASNMNRSPGLKLIPMVPIPRVDVAWEVAKGKVALYGVEKRKGVIMGLPQSLLGLPARVRIVSGHTVGARPTMSFQRFCEPSPSRIPRPWLPSCSSGPSFAGLGSRLLPPRTKPFRLSFLVGPTNEPHRLRPPSDTVLA